MRGAADAERRPAEDVLALEQDGAAVGAQFAGDEVEDGGLARAVRADQADDAALADVEGEIAHGDQPAEGLAQAADAEQDLLVGSRHRCAHIRHKALSLARRALSRPATSDGGHVPKARAAAQRR